MLTQEDEIMDIEPTTRYTLAPNFDLPDVPIVDGSGTLTGETTDITNGENLTMIRTDGKYFVDMMRDNGETVRLNIIWNEDEYSKKILTSDFVMVSLFCDANIDLPENEWVTDKNGKTYTTLGTKNFHYQQVTYNTNTQPYYVIIDADGKVLTAENYSFNLDVKKFINWLNEGLKNYKK